MHLTDENNYHGDFLVQEKLDDSIIFCGWRYEDLLDVYSILMGSSYSNDDILSDISHLLSEVSETWVAAMIL